MDEEANLTRWLSDDFDGNAGSAGDTLGCIGCESAPKWGSDAHLVLAGLDVGGVAPETGTPHLTTEATSGLPPFPDGRRPGDMQLNT
jgi:hypothetical protein